MAHLPRVAHVPAQRGEERIDELDSHLGFAAGLVSVEFLDQAVDAVRRAHRPSSCWLAFYHFRAQREGGAALCG